MFELKPIEADAIPRALAKAERYRLLNEPREAESICRDILAVDEHNADALVCLILALTDLFEGEHVSVAQVLPLVERLRGDYERRYYTGVVEERWCKALLKGGRQPALAYEFIRSAMLHFDAAQSVAPDGNDDATLRWNTCVRMIERHGLSAPSHGDHPADSFSDDAPFM